ncbi:hypothetical protein GCM10020254_37600 [Streptomyces goshikiensis]
MEAAGVHGAETALHVGHDLVLRLPDDEREHEEHGEDDDQSQGDVEDVVHASPPFSVSVSVSGLAFGSAVGSSKAGFAWCQGASALRGAARRRSAPPG